MQRERFRLALSLLPNEPVGRLLEIGYGNGIFLPELSRRCAELHGVDVHGRDREVAVRLAGLRVEASLCSWSVGAMPYPSEYFDWAVAVSGLEFLPDIGLACEEISRVLRPEGRLIVISPGDSPLVDFGLMRPGGSDKRDYGHQRERLRKAVDQHFRIEEQGMFPPGGDSRQCLYETVRLRRG